MDNALIMCGNVTAEPKLRYTQGGTPVVAFDIAVNRRWTDRETQQQKEAVTFVEVQCWRQLAENVAESVSKGQRVTVTGRLEQNNWTADDGSARSKLRIVGDDVGTSLMFGISEFKRVDRRVSTDAAATAEAPASESPSASAAGAPDGEEPF